MTYNRTLSPGAGAGNSGGGGAHGVRAKRSSPGGGRKRCPACGSKGVEGTTAMLPAAPDVAAVTSATLGGKDAVAAVLHDMVAVASATLGGEDGTAAVLPAAPDVAAVTSATLGEEEKLVEGGVAEGVDVAE